jgi:hypothetical protein
VGLFAEAHRPTEGSIAGSRSAKECLAETKGKDLGYDIFRKSRDGSVIWLGCASTVDEARNQLEVPAANPVNAERYFVYDPTTRKIVAEFICGPGRRDCSTAA